MARLRLCALMAAFAVTLALPAAANAQREDVRLGVGLANPTSMALAPDGRIFVNEQAGTLRVIKDGALLPDPFLQLSVTSNNERGLLGITFDPNFATNRYLYVYYTRATSTVVNRLSRFRASAVNPDVVEAGSETPILDDIPSQTGWHNGGAIHFGADGKLYVAVGEGHASNNAQRMDHLGGKLLRIDADGSIPTDNPFYDTATGVFRSIWALGLRNPFTFDVQPGTGRIFINDVGENAFEEINEAWSGPNNGSNAGFNFGWPATEGPTTNPDYHTPFYAYPQTSSNGNCALTGGSFYNPATVNFPAEYVGDYFFTDFCNGWIDSIDLTTKQVTRFFDIDRTRDPVDIKVGADGSLYYLSRENGNPGSVHRVRYTGASSPPSIVTHPQNRSATVGGSATFSVSASGTPPLSYQWQRNGTNISGATGSSYTFSNAQLSNNGDQFRVVVMNASGSATSNAATLTVTADQPPTATITAPAAGSLYSGGETINYSGTGTDPEDGTLGSSRFTWRVDFHHEDHLHPFMPDESGSKTGSFTASATGEASSDVWYRIHLTVTDSAGQTSTTFRDVVPRKANITLATNIAGLTLNLDGQPVSPPHTVTGVVGVNRTLEAPSPQTVGGHRYEFVSWSDGGSRSHTISTPSSDTTYTATFREADPPAVTSHPQSRTIRVGESATFSVGASGSTPLSYQWRRNGTAIPGATGSSYTLSGAQLADDGAQFRAVVTNHAGSATSNAATLTVASGERPTATITTPPAGSLYSGGETIDFAGTATDPEDGTLGASRFTWRVDFHRGTQSEPFQAESSGSRTGSFTASSTGETSSDVWYRIHLTVTDSEGLTATTYRDVLPRKAAITLATNVPGVQLELDGERVSVPRSVIGVAGVQRQLGAPSPQAVGAVTYEFVAWSDGGAQSHTITTPTTDSAYVATFRPVVAAPAVANPLAPALGPPLPPRAAMEMSAPKRIKWARARRQGIPVKVRAAAGAPVRVVVWTGVWRKIGSRVARLGASGDGIVRVRVRGRAPARAMRARIEVTAGGRTATRKIMLMRR